MGRPPRPMYVSKTSVYLTEEQQDAANNIRLLLARKRGIKITAQNDAVGYALTELSRTLEKEQAVKK